MKATGERSAGNLHTTFEAAGSGNELTVRLVRHSQRKRGATDRPDLRSIAPDLDPTKQLGSFPLCLFEVPTAELSRVGRPFHPPIAMGARLLRAAVSPGQEAPCGRAGVSLQMDSHNLSLLEGARGLRRERLPGSLSQAQLAAAGTGGTNQGGGVVRNMCETCGGGGEFSRGKSISYLTALLRNLGQSDEGRLNGGAQTRSVSSAQYEENDDDSGEHEGRTQTARHGYMCRGGRPRLTNRPCSRTGENPPYGILGRAMETTASFEARSAPSLYPTGGP